MSAGNPPGPAVTLRRAARDDAAALSRLIVATLRTSNAADYAPAVITRVAEDFSAERLAGTIERRHVLVACEGPRILGTAALDGDKVRSVFVAPERQGEGIGAMLMAEVFRLAAEAGVTGLTLQSSLTARGFYAGLGFAALGEAVHGDEVTIVMLREITSRVPA